MAIITSEEHNIIICKDVENKPVMLMCFCSLSPAITHPQSAWAMKCPQEIPAVNSEQISDAAHQICHLHWRASEGTVLENFLPRWLVGSPSPSSASVDPWSCSGLTLRTWWQEVVLLEVEALIGFSSESGTTFPPKTLSGKCLDRHFFYTVLSERRGTECL